MDEVDGMSAGDRGGVGALAALIRKTKVRSHVVLSNLVPMTLLDTYYLHRQ